MSDSSLCNHFVYSKFQWISRRENIATVQTDIIWQGYSQAHFKNISLKIYSFVARPFIMLCRCCKIRAWIKWMFKSSCISNVWVNELKQYVPLLFRQTVYILYIQEKHDKQGNHWFLFIIPWWDAFSVKAYIRKICFSLFISRFILPFLLYKYHIYMHISDVS